LVISFKFIKFLCFLFKKTMFCLEIISYNIIEKETNIVEKKYYLLLPCEIDLIKKLRLWSLLVEEETIKHLIQYFRGYKFGLVIEIRELKNGVIRVI